MTLMMMMLMKMVMMKMTRQIILTDNPQIQNSEQISPKEDVGHCCTLQSSYIYLIAMYSAGQDSIFKWSKIGLLIALFILGNQVTVNFLKSILQYHCCVQEARHKSSQMASYSQHRLVLCCSLRLHCIVLHQHSGWLSMIVSYGQL